MHEDRFTYRKALDDFHRFRSKAAMERFWAGIRGESLDLLPFDKVSAKLRAVNQTELGLQEVPLAAIIGSVNRTGDFDRNFAPLSADDGSRWANVKAAMTSPFTQGVPPVSLYKIGEAFFVLDGNHRVSIAKEMGLDTIEAYVTEVKTKVPLSSSFTLEELVEKAAQADFLENTHLDRILPGVDLSLKQIDNYPLLEEHINVHRYYMGIEQNREVDHETAARDWYERVYLPVVRVIESSGLHDEFAHLSLTDLYLLVLDKQHHLQEWLGTALRTEKVVDYLADQEGKQTKTTTLSSDIQVGDEFLFRDILVAISEQDEEQIALTQAALVNRNRDGNILGIYVKPEHHVAKEALNALEARFYEFLREKEMRGKFISVEGEPGRKLREFSLLSDLLVLKLRFPPGESVFDRISSGIIGILQSSRRPVLFVKEVPLAVSNILLIYDERERSREAFFVAAYYAARYGCPLVLVNIHKTDPANQDSLAFAQEYLFSVQVEAKMIELDEQELAERLPTLIEEHQISTVMMGGYESRGLLGRLLASNVDRVLETVNVPVMVFR